jgi:hypothetical protein
MANEEATKHLKPVSWGKLTKEEPIDPDELIRAIAQIKTFEDYLATKNTDLLFARKKEFSFNQSASMMVHTCQDISIRDQYQEISGEPSKQGSFPSGTEEINNKENYATFTPEKKLENISSPSELAVANMSPDIQTTETIMHPKESQNKLNWLHQVRNGFQCILCNQSCSLDL